MRTTNQSKKKSMIWGFSLHGWEDIMRASLAIVGVFGLIVGLSTWFVVKLQRQEIANSKAEFEIYKLDTAKQIADANSAGEAAKADAAKANERALQAQLELVRFKSPRVLDKPHSDSLTVKLKPFAPRRVDVLAYTTGSTPDTFSFANSLFVAFVNAHWNAKFWSVVGGDVNRPIGVGVSGIAGTQGDFFFDKRVVELLASEDIAASMWRSFIGTGLPEGLLEGPAWDSNDVAPIRIIVGTKP